MADLVGDVGDADAGRVRLAGDGAEGAELRAIEIDAVLPSGELVRERLQFRFVWGLRQPALVPEELEVLWVSAGHARRGG